MHARLQIVPSQGGSHLKHTVAANIDRGIRERGITNRAVGEAMGSTEHQVWRWRTGRHMPDLDNLAALANVLFGGDITELYADDEAAA